ncbi:zinc-binding dehydrogenase [Amphritea sp. 2_MG-2023]|uniref:zinc-binding dehydrogenase n=1 Tax=Amphritea TaxID=515417 RepID=UPI001C07C7D0|nr:MULTISPECIES: zinc-binding dehydrogenase [Amphritea]MBU2967375.1 zinc-binding dehydrogenase [Amphritea atlantica]MDO6418370.1 zinc-binding dehydrogenase [Amphritea sp. 2_MG-2023]
MSTAIMNAIELRQCGAEFDLHMSQRPIPILGDNELLIAIEYVAINHLDARLARDGFCQWQYPHILGSDAIGTVVDAPKGVFPSKGSRVLFNSSLAEQGMLKEYAVVPNFAVSEVPDSIASEIAVALPNAGMTALLALEKLQLHEGQSFAINSAQGAVAHFAVQYAKRRGAQVFAVAEKAHHKRLTKLGADFAFDCHADNICNQIKRELGPGGFDCILNTQGGDSFIDDLKRLRFCGHIACLNGFSDISEALLFEKAPQIGVVSLSGAWLANSLCAQQHLSFMGSQLLQDVASGDIIPPEVIQIPFSVDAVRDVLTLMTQHTCPKRPVVKIQS